MTQPNNPWQNTPVQNPWHDGLGFVQADQEIVPDIQPGRVDALDFWEAIAQNRRRTWLLVGGMLALAAGFGYILGLGWDVVTNRQLAAGMNYMATQQIGWTRLILTPSETGVKIGTALLAAMMVWSLITLKRADKFVLKMAGAREVPSERLPQLHNVVEEMAIAAGIPKPRVFLMPTRMPNAFATGLRRDRAAVGITTGLLESLTRRELQGVIAHEMGHILNDDMRYATIMAVMTGFLVFIAECVLYSRRFLFYGSHDRRGRKGHPVMFVIMIVIFMVTAILVPILAKLIQLAISRQREYLADATAVRLTRDPGGLIAALQKLALSGEAVPRMNNALEPLLFMAPRQMLHNGHSAWFSTHPTVESRVQRLKALE